MFLVLCLGGEFGVGCLELSIISMDSGLLALVPLYLSETKQPPDEGYIRHALSYFPTITPLSWTTTTSVPCLPLGFVDPIDVSQYCWPRGTTMSNLCPRYPILHSTCHVSLSLRYPQTLSHLQSFRHHSTFHRHHQTSGTSLLNVSFNVCVVSCCP